MSSACVIKELKTLFCTHGIPEIIISDNGPQFSSDTFRDFGRSYGFTHVTSSPGHPSGNGESERAVRTMKEILKKNGDQYLALLTHHTTPLSNGLSPCELLMGRKLRTTLPILPRKLIPGVETSELERVRERENHQRTKQQQNFNRRHRAKLLPKLNPGDEVWIHDMDREATVVYPEHEHSYTVATESGNVRRNRAALVEMSPRTPPPPKPPTPQKPSTPQKPQTPQRGQDQLIQPKRALPRMALDERVPASEAARLSDDGQRRTGSVIRRTVIVKPKRY